jgi:hypothetical protein
MEVSEVKTVAELYPNGLFGGAFNNQPKENTMKASTRDFVSGRYVGINQRNGDVIFNRSESDYVGYQIGDVINLLEDFIPVLSDLYGDKITIQQAAEQMGMDVDDVADIIEVIGTKIDKWATTMD